jgi:hypothetical protein
VDAPNEFIPSDVFEGGVHKYAALLLQQAL